MLQDSFAIYASNNCEIKMHINVWTNMEKDSYIDIGLVIYKKETFDTVSIYVPYQITSSDIFDLSQIIKEEPVMRGLFNKKCSITTSSIEDVYDVKFEDYCMKVIPKEMCLEGITKIEEGTLITLKVSQWSENNIAYIRFRLPYKSLSIIL